MNPQWAAQLQVYRMTLHWFHTNNAHSDTLKGMPCFGVDTGARFFYGFPALDGLLKVADHTPEEKIPGPQHCQREIREDDKQHVVPFAKELFGDCVTEHADAKTCLYTMTPDGHFFFDRHPQCDQMFVACGFSGHGFKFATSIGEQLARWGAGQDVDRYFDFLRWRQ